MQKQQADTSSWAQHELLLLLHVAQIHGIWFYDESDLQRLSSLLHKILNQLPKPDAADPATKAQVSLKLKVLSG